MRWLSIAAGLLAVVMLSPGVVIAAIAFRGLYRPRVLCLLYHRVTSAGEPRSLSPEPRFTISVEELDAQLAWLSEQGYTFVSASELLRFARGEASLPDRSVLLSFDDGCASIHAHALSTVRRHATSAIVFVTTDPHAAVFERTERRLLDEELAALAHAGFEIGSHGVSHRPLGTLGEATLRAELEDSKATLERLTGRPVRFLALPCDSWDARVLRVARELGYEGIFRSSPAMVRPRDSNGVVPRVNVEGGLGLVGFRNAVSPLGIALRRTALILRALPKWLVGMQRWMEWRSMLLVDTRSSWLLPSRMGVVLAASAGAGLLLSVVLGWLIARA